MKNHIFFSFILFFLLSQNCLSQKKNKNQKSKFFLTAGYGLAGSFFVRSYMEFAPLSRYKTFYNKNFIGSAQNAAIGIDLKKNWEVKMGINFQHHTRRVKSRDTLGNVNIILNHDIHNRDYMWYGSVAKKLERKNHLFAIGLGLYYLRSKAEIIEIYYPSYLADVEPEYKDSRDAQGGVFTEFAYEYKFQPKVNLGVKTQFYYTLSAAYVESITLFPYIKIIF